MAPFKDDMSEVLRYLNHSIGESRVKIRLCHGANASEIIALAPDVVIVRRSWWIMKNPYRTFSVAVGTVKKSMPAMASLWLRRKAIHRLMTTASPDGFATEYLRCLGRVFRSSLQPTYPGLDYAAASRAPFHLFPLVSPALPPLGTEATLVCPVLWKQLDRIW